MNPKEAIERFIDELEKDIRIWEEHIRFWEDPAVIGMGPIGGSIKTGKEIANDLRERIAETRSLIELVRSELSR